MLFYPLWKRAAIYAILLLALLVAIGNFIPDKKIEAMPKAATALFHKVVLGLDLEGGIHILLEIEQQEIWKERLEDSVLALRAIIRENKVKLLKPPKITRMKNGGQAGSEQVIAITAKIGEGEKLRKVITPLVQSLGLILKKKSQENSQESLGDAFHITLADNARDELLSSALQHTIEILRRRIDESGTREPLIQRQGRARILVEIPGVKDPEQVKSLLGKTAKLTFHLLNERATEESARGARAVPADSIRLPSYQLAKDGKPTAYYVLHRRTYVSGEHLLDAQTVFEDNRPIVSFRFNATGARRFGKVTKEHVGDILAVVLDNAVISAPRIQSAILGGSGVITGGFSVDEANELALLLRAGALPAPLKVIEERTVGPGLGRDSVEAGKRAAIIALILVLSFMILRYKLFGCFAATALIANLILILASLSIIGATLTLPGIAGIVLTTGMAVDANVLIFERIREESKVEGALISNIEAGYKRAIATILDSNITTLIAAVILFAFGSGPIRGFAVTLSLGIATSMFTAIMLTRMLIGWWLRTSSSRKLPV